ncbi:unnamed protein product, partial [Mesorhabditis belari]|uniref:Ground-like domain-containing protein n=1 Tax=Mesorhabditis belari TaxID=2138241 RepID=A0AAF3F185_9BILA
MSRYLLAIHVFVLIGMHVKIIDAFGCQRPCAPRPMPYSAPRPMPYAAPRPCCRNAYQAGYQQPQGYQQPRTGYAVGPGGGLPHPDELPSVGTVPPIDQLVNKEVEQLTASKNMIEDGDLQQTKVSKTKITEEADQTQKDDAKGESFDDFEKQLAELKEAHGTEIGVDADGDKASESLLSATQSPVPIGSALQSPLYLRPDQSAHFAGGQYPGGYAQPQVYARPVPYRPQPTYYAPQPRYQPQPIRCPMPSYRPPPQSYAPPPRGYALPQGLYSQIGSSLPLPTPLPLPAFSEVSAPPGPPPSPFQRYHAPSNECCGRCNSRCHYKTAKAFGVRNRKGQEKKREVINDLKCNSHKLERIMSEGMSKNAEQSKRLIQRLAEELLGALFFVVCSKDDFSYISRSERFCQIEKFGLVCYAFQHH